jgi:hypothetical protein
MPVVMVVTPIVILAVVLMRWRLVSLGITAVMFIVNGMSVPIRMIPFPAVKAPKPPWFTNNPDMARSQIVILTADDADVFVTVPDVIIRIHSHRHHGRGRFHGHTAIRSYNAAGYQCRGRQTANTQLYFIRAIHSD